jgi:trigger factor
MSLQVEKMEKNMAKLTIEVAAEDLEKAMQNAYQKAKGRISIPGFRKGKAPRKMIEQMYGKGVFLEDAVNALIPEHYSKALAECELEIVSQPTIDITQAEPGKAFIFTAEVATKPEVTLGDYKGVEVPKTEITVTDEDVDAEIKKEQEKNSRTINVEDRGAQLQDVVTIDFEGSVDGVPFDGGQATEYPLTLGSNTFIPGFEDQLVGAKVGDDVDVKVTFPEEYQAKELAGKEAIFKCAVKKIEAKELPELDDDFAKDVSEFDTLAEYKEHIKTNLVERKENEAKRAKEDAAVDKAIENAQMDIPEAMLQTQCRQMLDDFSRRMQSQGLSMDQYFQFTGMTAEKMMEDMKPQALKRIQTRLVLEKVAEVENIQPTEEEVNEEISKMAEAYKMEADKLKELLGERELEQMKKDMAVQKAVTVIADAAKFKVIKF